MTTSTIPTKPVQRPATRNAAPRGWTFFVPGFSILVFTLIVTLQWGFGPETIYVPPLLIMALIVSWTIRHPTLVPSIVVFVVGVAVDVVTASPIGYWAFLFLAGYACALHAARWEFEWLTLATLVALVPVTALVGGLGWILTSAYFAQFVEWQPVADSIRITWFICPLVVLLTRWCANWMARPAGAGGNAGSTS